ncbi:hypothetical protein ZYGR_0I01490 [Zygosaccharomyces rouxii]|uniref:ZYRO0C03542p n=2 Tax=Zygosaccharomyces rouxii TaxID=4956 RepID=C5DSW6_ZYGRC|nr:uncharacterized protein ZYRO0C03542g [Zygosaccharomyces rouxii]KAH9201933.1 hypothetical protein LQ764DRAFT_90117 [Zygosaccharomyces rouxii]GAV47853.1 hypothetical protein ZYGR_0I01490 [Zygosaccharomyces rouxii]CAR26877.1 ZYRO0C03542p [Zygosaccharomyces rouxii]
MAVQKRIYVGNLNNDLEGCLQALEMRFSKFGKCTSEFEVRGNFAYIDMEFEDDSRFTKLKSSFNHVKFKGNDLIVDAARPRWQWEEQKKKDDEEEPIKRKQIIKRHWEYYKKMENIGMSWEDRIQMIPGRHRTAKRNKQQLRNMTFRVDVNGSLKVYKCYKQKLWGYERDKEAQDLVHKFVNGKWRNGWDHIVDRLNYTRSKGVSAGEPIMKAGQEGEEEEEEEDNGERERTDKVLEDMFKSFDFDKPMVDDEAIPEKSDNELPADEDEHEHEIEVEHESKDEDEPIPVFGEDNQTKTLRNLFDPQENQPFKLITESDDDIDHDKDAEQEEVVAEPELVKQEYSAPRKTAALFFPHFDSPFLSGQTQLNKLPAFQPDWQLWQDQFWDQRIDWIKEMKRKRKDALRQLAKKKSKNGVNILV